MTKIKKILEELEIPTDLSINSSLEDKAKTNFLSKLDKFGYDSVEITNVEYDPIWGTLLFSFLDDDGDVMDLLLGFDEEDQAYAIPIDDDIDYDETNDDQEEDIIDIESVLPDDVTDIFKLADFDWITKPILIALLQAGSIGEDDYEAPVSERRVAVIRGGKKVKMTVKRKVRRKRLSPKQKQALKKARRKANTGSAKRNRKKSMKLRKRTNLKKSGLKSRQKLGA